MQIANHHADWQEITTLRGLSCGGVYAVRHEPSGRLLISQSADVARRVWDQRQRLSLGRHFNQRLQADFHADPNSITFWLIRKCDIAGIRRLIKQHHMTIARAKGLSYNLLDHLAGA